MSFVIERDPVTDEKVRRYLTTEEDALVEAGRVSRAEEGVQRDADHLLLKDRKFRVVLWLIYQIIVAIRTGDTTKLDTVTSMAKLRNIVVSRFRVT